MSLQGENRRPVSDPTRWVLVGMTAEFGARLTARPRSDRGDYHLLTSNTIDTRVSKTESCPSPLHSLSTTERCQQLHAKEQILRCHLMLCFPFTLAKYRGNGRWSRRERRIVCGKHQMNEGDRIRFSIKIGIRHVNGKHLFKMDIFEHDSQSRMCWAQMCKLEGKPNLRRPNCSSNVTFKLSVGYGKGRLNKTNKTKKRFFS